MCSRTVFMERLSDGPQPSPEICSFRELSRHNGSLSLEHLCFSVWELFLAVLSRSHIAPLSNTTSKELELVNQHPNSFLGQSWGVSTESLEGHSGIDHQLPKVLTCALTYLHWLSPFPALIPPCPYHASPDYVPPKWLASKSLPRDCFEGSPLRCCSH